MYLELLTDLDENCGTEANEPWRITLYSDGTGEIVHPCGESVGLFGEIDHLEQIACDLVDFSGLMTASKAIEIIKECNYDCITCSHLPTNLKNQTT